MKTKRIGIVLFTALAASLYAADLTEIKSTSDTWILEGSPSKFGTSPYLANSDTTGVLRRGLIYFDLSSYAGKTVESNATLTLYTSSISAQTKGDSVSVYLIDADNAGWTEGGANWTTKDGSAAWSHAGLGSSGDGYGSTPITTVPIPSSSNGARTFTIGKEIIQSWIDSSSSNAGVLIRLATEVEPGGDDTVNWHSKEQGGAYMPTLSFSIDMERKIQLVIIR